MFLTPLPPYRDSCKNCGLPKDKHKISKRKGFHYGELICPYIKTGTLTSTKYESIEN